MSPETIRPAGTQGWNILTLSNDNPRKILLVAVAMCLVCAVLVSGAAVLLKPLQDRNQALAVKREIIGVAGLAADSATDTEQVFQDRIEVRIVDLASGSYVPDMDPESFDPRAAARNPATSRALSRVEDVAGIKRRADYTPVYLVHADQRLETIIIPVHGYGLWSTLYGFLALAGDARTITGITFYEHAETPGLGDAIEKPSWQAQFHGKLAYDEHDTVRITVIKGQVERGSPQAHYQVDGIAGATLTSKGVTNLLHFWLGEQGFGPYLNKLRSAGGST